MKRQLALLLLLVMLPVCAFAQNQTYHGMNERVTSSDGLSVTIVNVRESTGSSWNRPDSGKVFLIVEFLFENNTGGEKTISSILQFEAYDDQDFEIDFDFAALMACDDTVDVTIRSGKRARGEMGWQVSRNWQSLEIHFKPQAWGREDLAFRVYRTDLSR